MNAQEYIYKSCFDGCVKACCSDLTARNAANDCLEKFKRNQFKKPYLLVNECIAEAVKSVKKK